VLAGVGCGALLVTAVMACVGVVLDTTATSTGGTWSGGVGLGTATGGGGAGSTAGGVGCGVRGGGAAGGVGSTLGAGGGGGGVSCSKMAWTTWGNWRLMSRVKPAWMAQNTSKCSNTTATKPQGLRLDRVCK
jgi:hypothetical protein